MTDAVLVTVFWSAVEGGAVGRWDEAARASRAELSRPSILDKAGRTSAAHNTYIQCTCV